LIRVLVLISVPGLTLTAASQAQGQIARRKSTAEVPSIFPALRAEEAAAENTSDNKCTATDDASNNRASRFLVTQN
jgi:hypothetical protein